MKTVTITQLKDTLSALLDYVKGGGTVLILDRKQPVAHIVAAGGGEGGAVNGKVLRLERAGLLSRGKGKGVSAIREGRLAKPKRKTSIVETLLDDRKSSL